MAGTALVTGASSGIGEAFARELARRGWNLILVARRRDRLEKLASELGGETKIVECDLASDSASLKPKVDELGVQVDLLVNNAGLGSNGEFVELDAEQEIQQVRVNCEAVVTLTHAFLPEMVKRRAGGVIVVASTAGMQPIPYQATYSATKAFARAFTLAVSEEVRRKGVRVLCVDPGPVPTEWQEIAGMNEYKVPGEVDAATVARDSMDAYERGKRKVIPGRLMPWVMRFSSVGTEEIKLRVTERLYRQ